MGLRFGCVLVDPHRSDSWNANGPGQMRVRANRGKGRLAGHQLRIT